MSISSSGRHANLPVWRDTNRLLVDIEQAGRRFPCYHNSMGGSSSRRCADRMLLHRPTSRPAQYCAGHRQCRIPMRSIEE